MFVNSQKFNLAALSSSVKTISHAVTMKSRSFVSNYTVNSDSTSRSIISRSDLEIHIHKPYIEKVMRSNNNNKKELVS